MQMIRGWLTVEPEIHNFLRKAGMSMDDIWASAAGGTTPDSLGRQRFNFFGRMFLVVENQFGGPHIKMLP